MTTVTAGIPFNLGPDEFVSVPCPAREGEIVTWDVRSERAVSVSLMDAENFDLYRSDQSWEYVAGAVGRKIHNGAHTVDYTDEWMLVIQNDGDEVTPVVFDVWVGGQDS